jgi:hypothetical protein
MQAAAALKLSTPEHPVTAAPTLPGEDLLAICTGIAAGLRQGLLVYQRPRELYPNH